MDNLQDLQLEGTTEMETQELSVWDYLERENPHAQHTQALYAWGLNCERNDNPFLVFLDLIGWSEEHYGEQLTNTTRLGYLELDYLADALKEYTHDPRRVGAWVDGLMNTEGV